MAFVKKTTTTQFTGSGITFPFVVSNGKVPIESDLKLIRSSIKAILGWNDKTRFFLHEYICPLSKLLEEPNDSIVANLASIFIRDSLERFEKRIQIINIEQHSVSSEKLEMNLRYIIKNTQTEDSFIYPFYRKIIY